MPAGRPGIGLPAAAVACAADSRMGGWPGCIRKGSRPCGVLIRETVAPGGRPAGWPGSIRPAAPGTMPAGSMPGKPPGRACCAKSCACSCCWACIMAAALGIAAAPAVGRRAAAPGSPAAATGTTAGGGAAAAAVGVGMGGGRGTFLASCCCSRRSATASAAASRCQGGECGVGQRTSVQCGLLSACAHACAPQQRSVGAEAYPQPMLTRAGPCPSHDKVARPPRRQPRRKACHGQSIHARRQPGVDGAQHLREGEGGQAWAAG